MHEREARGVMKPADELRAAVRLLRDPYNCLPGKDWGGER